ncbi:MAG: hypothetical protein R6V46_06930 [Desulfatiglandaceae bacterium]
MNEPIEKALEILRQQLKLIEITPTKDLARDLPPDPLVDDEEGIQKVLGIGQWISVPV